MSGTTHHEHLTFGILAGEHPKNIYHMPTFEFAKKVAKSSEVQGAECKMHYKHLEKGSDEQIIITMQNLAQKYPKSIYGMGHFEFGQNLRKSGIKQGAYCKVDQLHFIEGPIANMGIT